MKPIKTILPSLRKRITSFLRKTISLFLRKLQEYYEHPYTTTITTTVIIVIFLSLFILLMVNLSGEECRPCFIKNLGFTETNQSCNPGVLIIRLGYAIGGVIALFVAMAGAKRARALDETARAQEQGNIEERYKNAITQFGNENPSVRLAGAYGLYHLAKDNKDRRENICDVLCVHIRTLTTSEEPIFNRKKDLATIGGPIFDKESYSEIYKVKPSDEVQSILDILTKKDKEKDSPFKSHWINLENAYLNGANLIQAQLQGANLIEAQLQGANLTVARLQGANLSFAQLQGADLIKTQVQGANLRLAQLQVAYLERAQLQGADLGGAQFQGANLNETDLRGAFTKKDLISFSIDHAINQLNARKNQKDDIKNAIFSGGVTTEQLKNFKQRTTEIGGVDSFKQKMNRVEKILEDNINKPIDSSIPSGAITGVYPKAEADKIIAMLEEVKKTIKTNN